MSYVRASEGLDVLTWQWRDWVKKFAATEK